MYKRVSISTKSSKSKKKNSVSQRQKSNFSQSINSPNDHILSLQKTVGNQAVQRLFKSGVIQVNLRIGQSGDVYEQEADRVADMVLQKQCTTPECEEEEKIRPIRISPLQVNPSIQMQEEIEEEEEEKKKEEEEMLQMKQTSGLIETDEDTVEEIFQSRGSGRPLGKETREFMESRFGYDFSRVRVHTDSSAERLTKQLSAEAFTIGRDVYFGRERYNLGSTQGKRLLAHELTHVVQQGTTEVAGRPVQSSPTTIQRAAPAVLVVIGPVAAKCIIGAIIGALFDAAIQAALHAWRERSWRFWKDLSLNYCSIILSAVLGCIAAPISAALLEPWIAARLGTRLGGMVGTLLGKILLFIAKKLGMAIPKSIVGKLLKLGCISSEQATELGVGPAT